MMAADSMGGGRKPTGTKGASFFLFRKWMLMAGFSPLLDGKKWRTRMGSGEAIATPSTNASEKSSFTKLECQLWVCGLQDTPTSWARGGDEQDQMIAKPCTECDVMLRRGGIYGVELATCKRAVANEPLATIRNACETVRVNYN
jgi:hypothetical protein